LKGFTVYEDGFEWMKFVWLTWFGIMDQEKFVRLDLPSSERDLKGWN